MDLQVTTRSVQFCASLRIFGRDLDFEALSRALGVTPSETHRIGDRGLLSEPFAHDMWRLDSPLLGEEAMDAHLRWLRRALLPPSCLPSFARERG